MASPDDVSARTEDRKNARKSAETTASVAVVCAMFAVIGSAFLGAAWPGAVAACGISLIGVVVGCFQLRS